MGGRRPLGVVPRLCSSGVVCPWVWPAVPERFGTARVTETHRSPLVPGRHHRVTVFPQLRVDIWCLVKG